MDSRFRKEELDRLVAAVEAIEGIVLVAWEHHLIPAMTRMLLGAATGVPQIWPDDRSDVVWVMETSRSAGGRTLGQVPQLLLAGDRTASIAEAGLT